MLVGAFGSWPYGYYMLLRVVVCFAALLLALDIYRRTGETRICVVTGQLRKCLLVPNKGPLLSDEDLRARGLIPAE